MQIVEMLQIEVFGIQLPLAMSTDRLPIGLQFVGAYGREDVLLRLAAQLEEAAPWRGRRAPIHP